MNIFVVRQRFIMLDCSLEKFTTSFSLNNAATGRGLTGMLETHQKSRLIGLFG